MKQFKLLLITGLLLSTQILAQNVGINATGAAPDASAMLDIVSANRGLLIPRVALTATNAAGPIAAPTTSLLVYNTATAGAGLTAVTPGYYYWDGAAWVRFQASNTIDDWKLLGNAGTTAGTNFVGTTDAQHLDFRTNNTQRVRIMNSTHPTVGVGTAFPVTNLSGTTAVLHVHDGGGSVGSQLILSNSSTTSGDRAGLINFSATQVTNDRRTASIESYLTNYSAPNATGDLRFFTNNSNSYTEKMRIEGDGDVGIGATPDASAKLDVTATDKGILAPRVALTATNAAGPITTPATGLLVYNTATAGAAPNNVVPGYYYNSGTSGAPVWRRFSTGNGDSWNTLGNAGTVAATNFVGTTDNIALTFRTNNLQRLQLSNTNYQVLAMDNGSVTNPFYSWSADTDMGIWRPSANTLEFVTGSLPRLRIPDANQVHAMSNGTALLPFFTWNADPDMGIYRITTNTLGFSTNGAERMRIVATGRTAINSAVAAPSGQLEILGNFAAGVGNDGTIATRNTNASGIAIGAAGQNQTWNGLPTGSGGAFVGNTTGLTAFYTTAGIGEAIYAADGFGATWRIGRWDGAAYYKIIGTGAVSTVVEDLNNELVVMSCPETPENLFFDYGIGKLENGRIYVKIDPILTKNIIVDEEHPLKVFIQLEGECFGVYVTNKTAEGFEVIELNGGTSNTQFSYKIVATMGNQTVTSPNGISRTATFDKRWPVAPKAYKTITPLIPVD